MGSSVSSSVGDRRGNALRRSQRKSITGACSSIDKVLKAINKFRGTEDSEEYKNLKVKIIQIEKSLDQKAKDLQPQFRRIHEVTEQKIRTAHELLDKKASENKQNSSNNSNGRDLKSPVPKELDVGVKSADKSITNGSSKDPTVQSPTSGNKRNSLLLRMSKLALSKRDSSSDVEVTEVSAEMHKSPEATRKSIMKYGVPVLPSPSTDGVPRIVSFNTPNSVDSLEKSLTRHEKRLKIIKQDIANLEIRISEFVGKKNGTHYNNLKRALTQLVEELEGIHEEELLDQVVLCHNYIKTCFNFLDSKAVDADGIDDDNFTNYTDSRIYGSTHDLLEGHSVKTTAI